MAILPPHFYRETYSSADLQQLFGDFDIPAELQPGIKEHLEDAAAIWRYYRTGAEFPPPPAESKAALQKVTKAATRLYSALQQLPEPATTALNRELARLTMNYIFDQENEKPLPIFEALDGDGTTSTICLELSEIMHLVDAIRSLSDHTAASRLGGKRTKYDYALRMWVANMEVIWNETLGRPFTRDATAHGDPISEAARFCVCAFSKVSPDGSPVSVLNAMKSRIARNNAKLLANSTKKKKR